jgi:hypothetical protein
MSISELVTYGGPTVAALVAGGAAGAFTAWRLRRREPAAELVTVEPEEDRDPFVDAEIDLACVHWAEANGHPPEAAGLMAARLRNLHDIGKEKGWM